MVLRSWAARLLVGLVIWTGSGSFTPARAADIVIAVLDSPADYSHHELQRTIDFAAMKSLQVTGNDGRKISWYDYNQALLKSISDETWGDVPLSRGRLRILETLAEHGTFVTEILARGLTGVRILHFPLVEDHLLLSPADTEAFAQPAYRQKLRLRYRELSAGLKSQGVKIVNLSLGISEESALSALEALTSRETRENLAGRFPEIARAWALADVEEMSTFIKSNPDVAFVAAAGNKGLLLNEKLPTNSASIEAPNLIRVGALKKGTFELADFSNYSATRVDVATIGASIPVHDAQGGFHVVDGTSYASPLVAKKMVPVFAQAPHLSGSGAVQKLLSGHTVRIEALEDRVAGGRVLDFCNAVNKPQL